MLDDAPGFRCPRCRSDLGLETLGTSLKCRTPSCGAEYVTVHGIPAIADDDPDKLERLMREVDFSLAARYAPTHHPDMLGGPATSFYSGIARRLRPHLPPRAALVDLGCGPGGFLRAVRGDVARLAGLDADPGSLFVAKALLMGESVSLDAAYSPLGRTLQLRVTPHPLAPEPTLVLASALDPPWAAEAFDVVACLNMIDSVTYPYVLLGQADALLRPGGVMVLSAPYTYKEEITPREEWLEGPAELRAILRGEVRGFEHFSYELLEEDDAVEWWFHQAPRVDVRYSVHMVIARKAG